MFTTPAIADRVRETTSTTGTGTVTLLGAVAGFSSFSTAFPAASTQVYYCIATIAPGSWEVGIGTFTLSGTTLSRTTVLASSNAGAAVTFPAGLKDVFVAIPASKMQDAVFDNGQAKFVSFGANNASSSAHTNAAAVIREANFGGAQTGVIAEAPRLAFNWSGRNSAQIALNAAGAVAFLDSAGTGYVPVLAGDMTSSGTIYGNVVAGARVFGPLINETGSILGSPATPTRIRNPDGGAFTTNTSAITGALKITLPVGYIFSMVRFHVKIYEYGNYSGRGISRDITLGGYLNTANWDNVFAYQITDGGLDLNVRFGDDGAGKACVWLGDVGSFWYYPQVFISDVEVGYFATSSNTWKSGWAISFPTSFNNVTNGPTVCGKPLTSQNYTSYNSWNSITNIPGTSNWGGGTPVVANSLAWKLYGSGHVIFDTSNSLGPDGTTAVSKIDAATPWTTNLPMLVGWNGSTTYGVKVDRSRYAESLVAGTADRIRLDNAVVRYGIVATSGTQQYIRVGVFTSTQGGQIVRLRFNTHLGYNADNIQDMVTEIFFKTSNGISVNASGFAGNAWHWSMGANVNSLSDVVWVANAAGVAAANYTLYVNLQAYHLNSFYEVACSPGTTWVDSPLAAASDPGVASSTVERSLFTLKSQGNQILTAANVATYAATPTQVIDAGNIAKWAYLGT